LFPRLTINFNDNVQTVRVLGGVKGDNFDVAQMRSGGRQYQIDGGGGLDTLTGPNQDNFFALTGANSGSLNGIGFGYSNVESLAGNAKNDTFQFANGNIDGFLSGGGGNFDTLDYSLLGVASNVNLATGSAHDVGGGATGRVSGVEDVIGGRAADTIVGDGGNNILIGNGGNDSLEGGGGFDLLVGGDGKDDLSDTAGRAIYIGGKVAGTLQLTSGQQAVLTEWARTDLPGSAQQQFVKKVADLKSGVLGGAVRLDRSTLEADGKVDTLNPNPAPTAFDLFVLDRQDQFKFATNVPSAVELAREIIV
jgi:hypothetical protein